MSTISNKTLNKTTTSDLQNYESIDLKETPNNLKKKSKNIKEDSPIIQNFVSNPIPNHIEPYKIESQYI